jgi:hypothetical protein
VSFSKTHGVVEFSVPLGQLKGCRLHLINLHDLVAEVLIVPPREEIFTTLILRRRALTAIPGIGESRFPWELSLAAATAIRDRHGTRVAFTPISAQQIAARSTSAG